MRMNYNRKTLMWFFQKILYTFGKEVLFHKLFSLPSPFDKHFTCFPLSFVYARVQPEILFSLLSVYIHHSPLSHSLDLTSFMKSSPTETPTFLILYYTFPVFHTWPWFRLFLIFIYISRIRPMRTAIMSIISLIPKTLSKDEIYDQI